MFRTVFSPVACLIGLALCQAATAAEVIDAEIVLFDGRIVLSSYALKSDSEKDDAKIWNKLKDVNFRCGGALIIRPDRDNPLQATLEGKLKVEFWGRAETTKLRLIRSSKEVSAWKIHPDDVDQLAKIRK